MIDLDALRERQAEYECIRSSKEARRKIKKCEALRRQFVRKFPRNSTLGLTVKSYAIGHGDKDNFCYWAEKKTAELGHISGAYSTKFHLYFNKESSAYWHLKRYSSSALAIQGIRKNIHDLLTAGSANDLEGIRQAEISPMFKGKLLYLYFPTRFLNIFSEKHTDHYLAQLGLEHDHGDGDVIAKRQALVDLKSEDEVMREWTTDEFSRFLYRAWPPVPKEFPGSSALKGYILNLPPLSQVKPQFIDHGLGQSQPDEKPTGSKAKRGKTNFELKNRRNAKVGQRGEDVVLRAEKERLKSAGKPELAAKVKSVSAKDDSAGFDILSFETNGRERRIEVKSTVGKAPKPGDSHSFHISANEMEKAGELANYHLYLVFDAASTMPMIWPIENPTSLRAENQLLLEATSYRATLTVGTA